jgi:aspartyl-tRNA(Asn)/glutamyl-tRNA(Gln) amidotransferase subunit A
MTADELKKLTLAEALRMIASGAVSAKEIRDAVYSRIDRLNSQTRAFITVVDRVHSNADPQSSLRGLPVAAKDLFDTKGIRTTAGSKVFADRVPEENAACIERLHDHGAVIVGKTNLHEFAFGLTTVNPHYGAALNPWDLSRTTGGSSGGSANAVSLGMGLASLGTDTGGSIRIPAALCGIVGLKPTYGRVSVRGVTPLSWSFDHAGPMTKTAEDSAILLEIISGHDPGDPYTRIVSVPRYSNALNQNIRGLRVGVPTSYFFEKISSVVEAAVRKALQELERMGAEVVPVVMPGISIHRAVWLQIATAEAYSFHEPYLEKHAALYGSDVRARLEPGRKLLSVDYVRAQRARTMLKDECKRLFEKVDVVVTPTTPIPAPRIEDLNKPWSTASSEIALTALARLTRYFNVVGLPAISIPCGFTPEGLPIGVQIAGKAFDESTVLRVAHAYEQSARWYERTPTL